MRNKRRGGVTGNKTCKTSQTSNRDGFRGLASTSVGEQKRQYNNSTRILPSYSPSQMFAEPFKSAPKQNTRKYELECYFIYMTKLNLPNDCEFFRIGRPNKVRGIDKKIVYSAPIRIKFVNAAMVQNETRRYIHTHTLF